ncbi:hypothetical protein V2I71_12735 [Peribacillus frigoritolerans]|uniref:hypothetical protein n=1 Tax=Peribacillus frigoritolerans TaxID=450367 RepID=UPI002ED1A77D|nr:hypothetical protein V2I71_12735 [Peribacillus frigoritolerans]
MQLNSRFRKRYLLIGLDQGWKSYLFLLVLVYGLFGIFLRLDGWYKLEPLFKTLAFFLMLLIILYHILIFKQIEYYFSYLEGNLIQKLNLFSTNYLITISIFISYFISILDNTLLLIVITIIVLILIHIIIKFLQNKTSDRSNQLSSNPFFVLWSGLISTFIAFTLSMYAQEAFSNKEYKEKLITSLELALAAENNNINQINNERNELLITLENNDELTIDIFDSLQLIKKKNEVLEYIVNNAELYNKLSPMAQEQFTHVVLEYNNMQEELSIDNLSDFEDLEILKKDLKEANNTKKSYNEMAFLMLTIYSGTEVNREFIIEHLKLEKDYISGAISLEEYSKELEIQMRILSESLDIIGRETKLKDYLDAFTIEEKSGGTVIIYKDHINNRVDVKTKYPDGIEVFKDSLLDKLKDEYVNIKYEIQWYLKQ